MYPVVKTACAYKRYGVGHAPLTLWCFLLYLLYLRCLLCVVWPFFIVCLFLEVVGVLFCLVLLVLSFFFFVLFLFFPLFLIWLHYIISIYTVFGCTRSSYHNHFPFDYTYSYTVHVQIPRELFWVLTITDGAAQHPGLLYITYWVPSPLQFGSFALMTMAYGEVKT